MVGGRDDYHDKTNTFGSIESIKVDPVTGRLLESSWTLCPARRSKETGEYQPVVSIGPCLVIMGAKGVEMFNTERQESFDLPNLYGGRAAVKLGNSCIVVMGSHATFFSVVNSLSFTHASSKVPSLAHLSELAIMERLPEFEDVTTLLDWAKKHNAVHLQKAILEEQEQQHVKHLAEWRSK